MRNAFVVLNDGRAKIQTDPSEDDDVVNLRTLNAKIASGNVTGVEIDTTLTEKGKAADAQTTGDALAGKVDKFPSDTINRNIYAQEANGNPLKMYPQINANNNSPWWIPIYRSKNDVEWGNTAPTGAGTLVVPDPLQPYQAASKNYVDNNAGGKVYKHTATLYNADFTHNIQLTAYSTSSTPIRYSEIPKMSNVFMFTLVFDFSTGKTGRLIGYNAVSAGISVMVNCGNSELLSFDISNLSEQTECTEI